MKTGRWFERRGVGILPSTFFLLAVVTAAGGAAEPDAAAIARGKELFTREWLPGDRRSHGGDGLGPLYNARSCGDCHQSGGIGGAGPNGTNVTVVSAFLLPGDGGLLGSVFGFKPKSAPQPDRSRLAEIHPALRTNNSFPLHRFGTDEAFARWKRALWHGENESGSDLKPPEGTRALEEDHSLPPITRQVGTSTIQLIASERKPPSLFGAGLIDRIPERVLEEVAASQARTARKGGADADGSLPVSGRVARLRDGRVGRFGWKNQTATLREFTLQACAIELGLEVPGFPQAVPPWKPGYKAPGLDLTTQECDALIAFVASLPPPARKPPENEGHVEDIAAGKKLFERTGCAGCHRPNLGNVKGIYSDLLLHDMGKGLSDDSGVYDGRFAMVGAGGEGPAPLPVVVGPENDDHENKIPKFGAAPREWRTPPLWGFRHSGSYLHDGGAGTLSMAVGAHGGEGLDSAHKFAGLYRYQKEQIKLFLESLEVPER